MSKKMKNRLKDKKKKENENNLILLKNSKPVL